MFVSAEKIVASNGAVMNFAVYASMISISWIGAQLITVGELTTGQLTGETVERKATAHRFSDEKHKKTVVTYTYYVNNEPYQCECVLLDRFQAMPASTRVVYQRKRPEYAYLPEFEEPDVKGMRVYYLCSAVFFLLAAVLFICFTM